MAPVTCPKCKHRFTPTESDVHTECKVHNLDSISVVTLDIEATLGCPECGAEIAEAAVAPSLPLYGVTR